MTKNIKELKKSIERWAIAVGKAKRLSLELKEEREKKESQK